MSVMDFKTYKKLLKLFQEYYPGEYTSAVEFVETKLESAVTNSLTNDEIEKFLLLVNHKNFLEIVKDNFVSYFNCRNYKEARLVMVLFFVIFYSNENAEFFNVCKEVKCAFKRRILEYFCNENSLIQTALAGCKFFDDEYVLDKIINPLLSNIELFRKVNHELYNIKCNKYPKKIPTIPDNLMVLQRLKPAPIAPANTPYEMLTFRAADVPKSIYMSSIIEKKLLEEHEKNKLKAKKLLAQAKALSGNYCKPREQPIVEAVQKSTFKAKKAPSHQNVEIKRNTATLLRDADVCIKEHEQEIKNIESILKGGFTLEKYNALVESTRDVQHQKHVEDIERKHLEGLVTFEEAILAKNNLLKHNKDRFRDFQEEREQFLKKLEEWKEEEQEKIKILVRKGQEIERNAKESGKKLKEDRRNQAQEFKNENKKLLQEACDKQKEELARKVKLIEEIKSLQQLGSLQVKKFDATESSNLGLLCEMSIAELQESLGIMKRDMQRQLEQKRWCISKYRARKKEMVENVKNYIAQCRMSKSTHKTVPIRATKLATTPDLDKLRTQLAQARELRRK